MFLSDLVFFVRFANGKAEKSNHHINFDGELSHTFLCVRALVYTDSYACL